jgi:hypothetical protein
MSIAYFLNLKELRELYLAETGVTEICNGLSAPPVPVEIFAPLH